MKKTLKTLMLIGLILLGINFTVVKAETTEETTVPVTGNNNGRANYRTPNCRATDN